MPDNLTLVIAETYGQSPHEVEQWPACWYERAVLRLRAKNIEHENRERAAAKKRKKK